MNGTACVTSAVTRPVMVTNSSILEVNKNPGLEIAETAETAVER